MPVLIRRGHRGPHVTELQAKLNYDALMNYSAYPSLIEDGAFGKNTKRRVEEFQGRRRLKVDGIVGPNTWFALTGSQMPAQVENEARKASAVPTAPSGPPSNGHIYILDSKEFANEQATGRHLKLGAHKASDCHYIYVTDPQKIPDDIGDIVKDENIRIKDVIMVGHGEGGGTIQFGGWGIDFTMHGNVRLFKHAVGHFAPGAIIWIFACSFAAYRKQDNNTRDHDLLQGSELIYDYFMEGRGYKAMRAISDYTGCEVRAGLDSQTKNINGFRMAWSKVKPGASRPEIYLNGQLMQSFDGLGTFYAEQVMGTAMKFVSFFK